MGKFTGAFEDKTRTYHISFNDNNSFVFTGIHATPNKNFPDSMIVGFYTLYTGENER